MKPKLHVRFWSRAGMATFRLRQRHQEFNVPLYSLTATVPGIVWDEPQGAGCERERDKSLNSGEPGAVKVCAVVRTERIATRGGRCSG